MLEVGSERTGRRNPHQHVLILLCKPLGLLLNDQFSSSAFFSSLLCTQPVLLPNTERSLMKRPWTRPPWRAPTLPRVPPDRANPRLLCADGEDQQGALCHTLSDFLKNRALLFTFRKGSANSPQAHLNSIKDENFKRKCSFGRL